MTNRYIYAIFPTRNEADEFLNDMWEGGNVATAEWPRIEKRTNGYAITLACE